MKAMLQAGWLLTTAFGSLIVIIIAESKFFDSLAIEMLFFAALETVVTILFMLISRKYKMRGTRQVESESSPLLLDSTSNKDTRV